MKIGKPASWQGLFKFLFLLSVAYPLQASAQNTDSIPKAVENPAEEEEEEDFEKYANLNSSDGTKAKAFCTSKVVSQTPNRLISIGYDVFGPFKLGSNMGDSLGMLESQANLSHGLRLEANFPVVSNNRILFSLGGSYTEQNYVWRSTQQEANNPMYQTLAGGSIRNLGMVATVFKPFNERNFLLAQGLAEYAGDWNFAKWQSPAYIKYSATAIFGWKPSDRKMWGIGLTRTYRAGEINYLPVFLFNYTSKSEKWGLEMLLPARADYRYNISKRNIIRAGVELEGTSYRLNDRNNYFANHSGYAGQDMDKLELRRSDIRLRAMWDFPMKDFYWLSVSAGYRLVYRYNVDNIGEVYRGFGLVNDAPYLLENEMGGAFFISIVATFVSP
jgi:hypothetical protein